jgi:oligoribonuclease NrnB/cAMP/cGMP phosphodiesterase (DHH superfamily)
MSNDIHVFTHNDLDGVGCLLALIWSFPESKITYTCVASASVLKEKIIEFNKHKNFKDYSKVFITDLSVQKDTIPLIDQDNVIVIDHHKTSEELVFTRAKKFIKQYTSCTLFIYKLFKSQLNLNNNQKQLLIYIDDYDSYQLKFLNTTLLNKLFWAHYYNNVPLFINDFIDGLLEFSPLQRQAIDLHEKKILKTINSLSYFSASVNIQGAERRVVAAFANTAINDVADHIIQKYNADIAIVVNIDSERVSFRRGNDCNVDVSLLAQSLCEGGGHEAAAGGRLTEKFMSFTKLFTPT